LAASILFSAVKAMAVAAAVAARPCDCCFAALRRRGVTALMPLYAHGLGNRFKSGTAEQKGLSGAQCLWWTLKHGRIA